MDRNVPSAIRIIEFRVYQMFYRVTFRYFKFENSTLIGFQKMCVCLCAEKESEKETEEFIQQFSTTQTQTHTYT